ncbi:MAG: amidohydrolase family protein [Alphaproteobacteria bacterium]|jgi:predicted TIM-barrel fold metal-dependent hydrolase
MSIRIVDADAHVIETMETFNYLSEDEQKYRPVRLAPMDDDKILTQTGNQTKEYWLVDGSVWTGTRNQDYQRTTPGTREMTDIEGRLRHMDEMGVDVQVLYPSFFLSGKTENPDWNWALCRSYNRWMADIWKKSNNRLRWVAIPPLHSMETVREELAFCKENGACGVFLVGIEDDKMPDDPYFYPLWEAAQELDLAACFHSGIHSQTYMDMFKGASTRFMSNRSPGVGAFHALIMRDIPKKFPAMRWGFVEFSASWLPYAINYTELSYWKNSNQPEWDSTGILKNNNIYVACQVTDDLPYIIDKVGEDNLVIGTDYGHHDQATEIDAMQKLRDEGTLSGQVVNKILDDNARAFYGLD